MSKLLLRLPDGSMREYPLERERLTIGRRADNDICLPYPAVSGEHAVVVTILDDSFLEDLGSTNGTLVNGKAITKHFLRDSDQIDIGRQLLVYASSAFALLGRASATEPMQTVAVTENGGATIGDDDATVVPPLRGSGSDTAPKRDTVESAASIRVPGEEADIHAQPAARLPVGVVAGNDAPLDAPSFEVLDGPDAGHVATMVLDDFVFGRLGTQIASVRRSGDAFRLVHLEGETRTWLNGAALSESGADLAAGDVIEVAGRRVAFRPAR